MKVKFNAKDFSKTIGSVVDYSQGFIDSAKENSKKVSQGVAEMSVDAFYEYLDNLARSHPGMLHHVYEWGQTGDPFGRLAELKTIVSSRTVTVSAEFLESQTSSGDSNQPFYDKARIMEEGISVVINTVQAKALFFEVDGEEFFRVGPIYIANPGGSQTRGSFVKAFDEFYGKYFKEVFLNSINFYSNFSNPQEYKRFLKSAVKGNNSYSVGKNAALAWIDRGIS